MAKDPLSACCYVGGWPNVEDVDADLLGGMGIRTVARKYNTSKATIERHRACLGLRGRVEPPTTSHRSANHQAEPWHGDNGQVDASDSNLDGVSGHWTGVREDAGAQKVSRAVDPTRLVTTEERAAYIADLVLRARWNGQITVRRLASLWQCADLDEVYRLRRQAQTIINRMRGNDLQAFRDEALADLALIQRRAMKKKDHRAAVAARTEADKILGLHPGTRGPLVQVNLSSPELAKLMANWGEIVRRAFPELGEIPDAARRLHEAAQQYLEEQERPVLDVAAE